jgi:transglutaminase-like putative cysteine protease
LSMKPIRRRQLFNCLGGAVVAFWVLMIGLLIHKTHFQQSDQPTEISSKTVVSTEGGRDWMAIYLKDKKVGYSMTQVDPVKDDFLIWEEMVLNLNLIGQPSAMRTNIRSLVDPDFRLKEFTLLVESGVVRFQASGKVEGRRLLIETGEGRQKRSQTIQLTDPAVTGSGMSLFFRGRPLNKGDAFTFLVFDPSTMAQKKVEVRVTGRESIEINRIAYDAFRLETQMWGQTLVIWLDQAGQVLKEEGLMGLTLVRSSAAAAPRDLRQGESIDFYEMAAVEVRPKLRRPERLTYVKLRVEGLNEIPFDAAALNSGRQRLEGDLLEIVKEEEPLTAGYLLPLIDGDEELAAYLRPGFNIESDSEAIVSQARDIVGNTRDPVVAARNLMAWVYRHVEKRPVLSLPSALEVLKTRMGDCNEHAVLLTALLRASGIPARECVGLSYVNDRFFYHAWTEAYIGRWVSMDATLNQMPTDAAHVRLAWGALDRQTDIIPFIGAIKLSVLDYGYDTIN